MQKKLIALAVAGAFAAPVAFAATSNVDIYGKLHFSVNVYNDEPSGSFSCTPTASTAVPTACSGAADTSTVGFSSNASRIGFKGSEDLGGGLSAIWQVESTVNLDEGGGWGSGRNTFVGLSSKSLGTVLGGKHDTPLKLVGRAVDLFGDTLADSRNVMGGGSDTRADNVVAYASPDFSGFSFMAAYTTDLNVAQSTGFMTSNGVGGTAPVTVSTASGDRDDLDAYNLSAQYKNGPIYIGVGYGDGDYHENVGLGAHWRVAGAFDMGDLRIVGQYDNLEADGSSKGDYDAWMVGAQYKMGAWVFKGNYMEGEYDDLRSGEVDQWTVGVDYNLSKRTTVYLMYVDGQNITLGGGAAASDQVGYSPNNSTNGDEDISAFSLGIVHTF